MALLGLTNYGDNAGSGIPIFPQIVAGTPAEPFACVAGVRGKLIYVDDNNDTTPSFLCFCGVGADDSTYGWKKVADPTANCF